MRDLRGEANGDCGLVAVVSHRVRMRRRPDDALPTADRHLALSDDEHDLALRHVGDVDTRVRDRVLEPRMRCEGGDEQLEMRARNPEGRELDALPTRAAPCRLD